MYLLSSFSSLEPKSLVSLNVKVPLVTLPPVVAALNSKEVLFDMLDIVAPVGMPVPETCIPMTREAVLSIDTLVELL